MSNVSVYNTDEPLHSVLGVEVLAKGGGLVASVKLDTGSQEYL